MPIAPVPAVKFASARTVGVVGFAFSLMLAGCDGGESASIVKLGTMKDRATSDVRTIRATTGMRFSAIELVVQSCNTDGAGNSWRATAVGVYEGPKSVEQSQTLIDGWVKELAPSGWTVSGYGAASQTPLSKGALKITLTQNNPRLVDPNPLNFEYYGPCHALSRDDQDAVRSGDGGTQDIRGAVS